MRSTPSLPTSALLGKCLTISPACLLLTPGPRNFDLHVTSSCHRIKVYSINRQRLDTAQRLKELELRGESLLPITKPLEYNLESDEHYDAVMTAKGGRDPAE